MSRRRIKLFATGAILLAMSGGAAFVILRDHAQKTQVEPVRDEPTSNQVHGSGSGSESVSPSASSMAARPRKFKFIGGEQNWENVIAWFEEISGLTYAEGISTPTGPVTLALPKVSRDFTLPEIADILNEALLARKPADRYLLIRRQFTFTFVRADEELTAAAALYLTPIDRLADCGRTEIVAVIIPLKDFDNEKVAKQLKPLKSSFGRICAIPPNSLFVVDTAGVIRGSILPMTRSEDDGFVGATYTHACLWIMPTDAKRMLAERVPARDKASKASDPPLKVATDEDHNLITG